ncbi:unnamed protein product [Dovyalis caffra]|uniref:CRAL-TRIO domain-containing protein n=1 Tax=Dovyalis caffra TaxID=77055 RepID=A0AAV1QSS8_9ROSI|nr:unnamed protein product [Dovyalis caffra]
MSATSNKSKRKLISSPRLRHRFYVLSLGGWGRLKKALLACQMDKKEEIALDRMRKSVQKLGGSTEVYAFPTTCTTISIRSRYGDLTLTRFLKARKMDPEKAAKMFVQWQTWRASFVPNGFILESQIPDELEARKTYLQGLSKDGYPAYYPERLAKLYLLYMPRFFQSVWKMVCLYLDKGVREKVEIVKNNEKARNEFVEKIGEEVLPKEFGGQAQLVALQDVMVPQLNC